MVAAAARSSSSSAVEDRPKALAARLRELRSSIGLTQAELAEALAYDRSTVAHAERGRQPPARPFWTACDELFRTGTELAGLYDAWVEAKRRRSMSGPADPRAHETTAVGDTAVAQPSPGGLSGGLLERMVTMAADDSARFAQRAEATNVGPHTIEQFQADITRIVSVYPSVPLPPVLREVIELRNRAFELLEGRQQPGQACDLYLISGVLCAVLANASFDLGAFAPAQTQARTAFVCAELAGSNWLRAWVRGMQALIAYWSDRPADAVALARAGWDHEPEGGTARVRLAAIEARAQACLGDSTGVDKALARANEAFEQADKHSEIGGLFEFPAAKQAFYAATCHLTLGGDHAASKAETLARQSVAWYDEPPPEQRRIGEQSLARLELATAHLQQHDLAAASSVVRDALAATRTRRTDSVIRRCTVLAGRLDQLAAAGERTAGELREEIRDVLTATESSDSVVAELTQ
jgi:DNA-binding XRE family transcriptional regulator